MNKNYKEILCDLENSIKKLEREGISIKPLNDSLNELKKHSENIQKVEDNIEAIREEVINQIKDELEQNKKASKFSFFGFWVGAIALVITTVTIINNSLIKSSLTEKSLTKNSSIKNSSTNDSLSENNRLNVIEKKLDKLILNLVGFTDDYKPTEKEIMIESKYYPQVILISKNNSIGANAESIEEEQYKGKLYPTACLVFYINEKKMGLHGLKKNIKIQNVSGLANYDKIWKGITISEGDKFEILNKYTFEVIRIYRKDSSILNIADSKNAVLIRKIENKKKEKGASKKAAN